MLPLRPGAHVFIATNAFLAPIIYSALVAGGLEFRGQIIRLVRTLRGGDRPKNSEHIFPEVSSMPRSCYEPWGLFRKPIPPKMTVGDCLKVFGTGGIRRLSLEKPFPDVIESERTSQRERKLANHPSLKPQTLLRQLTFASLPLGFGVILDPFMGSGSTIAAVESLSLPNVKGIGVEKNAQYFEMAIKSVPALRDIQILESPSEIQQDGKELKKKKQALPLQGQLLLSSL